MALQPLVPGSPGADVLDVRVIKVFEKADERVLPCFHRRRAEAEREHERATARLKIDLTGDCNVSVLGSEVAAVEPFVGLQLLPAIRDTHESDRTCGPGRRGCECECVMVPFGKQQGCPFVIPDPGRVIACSVCEVRSQENE